MKNFFDKLTPDIMGKIFFLWMLSFGIFALIALTFAGVGDVIQYFGKCR